MSERTRPQSMPCRSVAWAASSPGISRKTALLRHRPFEHRPHRCGSAFPCLLPRPAGRSNSSPWRRCWPQVQRPTTDMRAYEDRALISGSSAGKTDRHRPRREPGYKRQSSGQRAASVGIIVSSGLIILGHTAPAAGPSPQREQQLAGPNVANPKPPTRAEKPAPMKKRPRPWHFRRLNRDRRRSTPNRTRQPSRPNFLRASCGPVSPGNAQPQDRRRRSSRKPSPSANSSTAAPEFSPKSIATTSRSTLVGEISKPSAKPTRASVKTDKAINSSRPPLLSAKGLTTTTSRLLTSPSSTSWA